MKRKLFIVAAIVLASMNFASCIVAEPRGGGTYYQRHRGHHDHGHHYGHVRDVDVIVR